MSNAMALTYILCNSENLDCSVDMSVLLQNFSFSVYIIHVLPIIQTNLNTYIIFKYLGV